MPSRRLLGIALLLILASSIAVLDERVAPVVIAIDVFVATLFLIDLALARARTPSFERVLPGTLVQATDAELALVVRGARGLAIEARDALHPGVSDGPRRVTMEIDGDEAVWRYKVRPMKRGTHTLGPVTLRILGPLGLALSQRDVLGGESVRVLPQVRWDGEVGHFLKLAHRRQLGQNPLKNRGTGYEPYALREYRSGDPRTKIHWKASARRGQLVSREDAWERGARLTILLDCGRPMTSLDGDRGKLDWALAASLAIVRVAASRGDYVRVVAFADRIRRTVSVRPGARGATTAYASLFDLEAELSESAYEEAAEAVDAFDSRRSIVLLMTSVVDIAAAESVRTALAHLKRRHRPILVNLEDPDLHQLGGLRPATPAEAIAKSGALGILVSNRRMAVKLRHSGVAVASVSAKDLAGEALRAYLQRAS